MFADIRISKHFTFMEFVNTSIDKFRDINIKEGRGYITEYTELAENLLEPIRKEFNTPIHITSGFRCKELNSYVKGSKTSQHLLGQAVDIVMAVNMTDVFNWIKSSGLKFGQNIDEFSNAAHWVHISLGYPYRDKKFCNQNLTQVR